MKHACLIFSFTGLALSACDQSDVKKEAYDQGFADGQASVRAEATPAPALRAAPTAVRPVAALPATPAPPPADPQIRRILPNSKLQGTALDQKPKTR
jgi:hypothetical protein